MKQYAVRKSAFTCLLMLAALSAEVAFAQSTAFTYQGRLEDNGVPANDDFAFVVRLFDDADTGVQLGPTVCEDAVDVVNGLFTLSLDFGFQFDSGQQFLDIQVLREGDCADTSGFEQLSPRQQVTATPMALRALEAEVAELTGRVERLAPVSGWPKGLGALTSAILHTEVIDWKRFTNRRQVASYTGLCPSEDTSDERRRQGAINKHGNPRVRHALVEAIWRMLPWQPHYPPLQKLRLAQGARARKRAAVAAARRLAVDLWRIHTGQCPGEKLGLIMAEPA